MASTGNIFPGTSANVDRAGNTAWLTPENAVSDNGVDTTVVVPSDYLVTSNYGFSSIPDDATILGITARVEVGESGTGSTNYTIQLHSNTTPTLIGASKASGTISGTTKVIITSGSATDLWSATLTPATVKNSGFGVSIWSTDTTNTIQIDYVTLAVEYSYPIPGNRGARTSAQNTSKVKHAVATSFLVMAAPLTLVGPAQQSTDVPRTPVYFSIDGKQSYQDTSQSSRVLLDAAPVELPFVSRSTEASPEKPRHYFIYDQGTNVLTFPFLAPFVAAQFETAQEKKHLLADSSRGVQPPVTTGPFMPFVGETAQKQLAVYTNEQWNPTLLLPQATAPFTPTIFGESLLRKQLLVDSSIGLMPPPAVVGEAPFIPIDYSVVGPKKAIQGPFFPERAIDPGPPAGAGIPFIPPLFEYVHKPKSVWDTTRGSIFIPPAVAGDKPFGGVLDSYVLARKAVKTAFDLNGSAAIIDFPPIASMQWLESAPRKVTSYSNTSTSSAVVLVSTPQVKPFFNAPQSYEVRKKNVAVWDAKNNTLYFPADGVIYTISPTGGIVFSGTVEIDRTRTFDVSGGIAFSGTVTTEHVKTFLPTGGIEFTGNPLQIKTNVYDVTGSIVFGGTGSLIFIPFGTSNQPKLPMTGAGIT